MKFVVVAGLIRVAISAIGLYAQTERMPNHESYLASEVKWEPAPASLPPGAQAAILEGNPMKYGPFTLRLKLPDGYRIPPHLHTVIEHITVIQGTFVLGMGEKVTDQGTKALTAGSFAYMLAGTRHFVRVKGETIVQLHGTGPWGIIYVDPSDDPRKK